MGLVGYFSLAFLIAGPFFRGECLLRQGLSELLLQFMLPRKPYSAWAQRIYTIIALPLVISR